MPVIIHRDVIVAIATDRFTLTPRQDEGPERHRSGPHIELQSC